MTDASDESPIASLSLTHVHYDPNDPISLLCAYVSLIPQALMIIYASLFWSHRELEIILMLGGQLFCEAVNFVLKRVLKESRPSQIHGKGYGMPSSHAQFVSFFATYLVLWVGLRVRYLHRVQRVVTIIGLLSMAAAVSSSRVYLHYHSPRQVGVGVGIGTVLGMFWFGLTDLMKGAAGGILWDIVLEHPLSRWFYVKDMCTDLECQRMEWNVWWDDRQLRKRQRLKPPIGAPTVDCKQD